MNPVAAYELQSDMQAFEAKKADKKKVKDEVNLLLALIWMMNAKTSIHPEIIDKVPSYQKLIPILNKCLDELKWDE